MVLNTPLKCAGKNVKNVKIFLKDFKTSQQNWDIYKSMDILKEYETHYTLILRRIVTKNFIRKKKHCCKKVTSLAFVSSSCIQPFL